MAERWDSGSKFQPLQWHMFSRKFWFFGNVNPCHCTSVRSMFTTMHQQVLQHPCCSTFGSGEPLWEEVGGKSIGIRVWAIGECGHSLQLAKDQGSKHWCEEIHPFHLGICWPPCVRGTLTCLGKESDRDLVEELVEEARYQCGEVWSTHNIYKYLCIL